MGELDGLWRVDRVGGVLPPLYRCRKRIEGDRGTTEFGSLPGLPFEVRGLELHYRGLFTPFVDKLEPRDGEYVGRATVFGRELGRFRMTRVGEPVVPPRSPSFFARQRASQ